MHHMSLNVMYHIVFRNCMLSYLLPFVMQFALGLCVCVPFFFFFVLPLVVAPKGGKKFKTRANRNLGSSSSSSALGDRERFMSANMRRHMRP